VLIYRRTGNLRALQLLLGILRSRARSVTSASDVDDAIEIADKIDI
jgi:hypothetical protein